MIRLKSLLIEGNGPITGTYLNTATNLAKQLISRGFSDIEAAAIVGNMWAESTFDPSATNSIGAIGLLQWLGSRKDALLDYAKQRKQNWTNVALQLDFIKYELLDAYDGKYAYEQNKFNQAMQFGKTVTDKAHGFAVHSERPKASELQDSLTTRKIAAKNVYDILSGNSAKTSSAVKSNLIGKTVYPTKKNGFVNVRSQSYVDNGLIDNLNLKVIYPKPVGYIKQVVTGEDGNTWYEVVLMNKETGYVRSDVVTTINESQYEIKSGDTLTKIASENNTTVEDILQKNQGLQADKIRVGQKIKI
jgi:LysM repeat protein